MNIGLWNFYRSYNGNRMITDETSDIGENLCYPTVLLAKTLKEAGHMVNTIDMSPLDGFDAVAFFDHPTVLSARFNALRRSGKPLYLFLNENKMNRPDNYISSLHSPFKKVFTWDTSISGGKYAQFRLPVKVPQNFDIPRTVRHKLCVAVFSNKTACYKNELYSEREKFIGFCERIKPCRLDLYGHGWRAPRINGMAWRANPFIALVCDTFGIKRNPPKAWCGTVTNKIHTMRGYKFALAYENAAFHGYITEKLFDAMFAGCVPIYLGAPDITNFVPAETFIDRREFRSDKDLYRYMVSMSDGEYERKLAAIESFVNGEKIKAFGAEAFVQLFQRHVCQN